MADQLRVRIYRKAKVITMQNFVLFLSFCALLSLSSCSVKNDDPQPVAPPQETPVKTSAGPYIVDFDPATNSYTHNFFINIQQIEGKVEYFISPSAATDILIEVAQSNVLGCVASQVHHEMFWAYDHRNPLAGRFVFVGSSIHAYEAYKGILTHSFRGLQGCRSLELTMKLKK